MEPGVARRYVMAAATTKIPGPLDGEFRGKTTKGGFSVLQRGRSWATCRSCGSSLYPSRREGSIVRVIDGQRVTVEKYRCRCNAGREVRRPWEEGAQAA
jgi:hypothetical protein